MSFLLWLNDGANKMSRKTARQRLFARIGFRRAAKRKNVFLEKPSLVSPFAMVSARKGILRCGKGMTIDSYAVVQGNVRMGENCSVNPFAVIVGYGDENDRDGEIVIGSNVRIASHAMIIGANHRFDDPDVPICKQGLERKSIVIGDDVWIAGGAHILAGVTVGKGSVIAAGAVVTHDVPPYSVAAGVPAKVIKERR